MMQNTRESRLRELILNQDFIIQRSKSLQSILTQKQHEIEWLQEMVNMTITDMKSIKEEIEVIQHTKGGPKDAFQ